MGVCADPPTWLSDLVPSSPHGFGLSQSPTPPNTERSLKENICQYFSRVRKAVGGWVHLSVCLMPSAGSSSQSRFVFKLNLFFKKTADHPGPSQCKPRSVILGSESTHLAVTRCTLWHTERCLDEGFACVLNPIHLIVMHQLVCSSVTRFSISAELFALKEKPHNRVMIYALWSIGLCMAAG